MHRIQSIGAERPFQTTHSDVVLASDNDADPGFLRITATATNLTLEYFLVPFDGSAPNLFDSVTI